MAYVISDKCTSCGSCVEVCPSEAISKGEDKYVIDPNECVDCGACEDECPSEAISAEWANNNPQIPVSLKKHGDFLHIF